MHNDDIGKMFGSGRVVIPKELDAYIERGIADGKASRQRYRKYKVRFAVAFMVVFIITGSMMSIRLSPSLAETVSQLPIVKQMLDIFQADKGVELAAENAYMQDVGVSDERRGVSFTVDRIIVDQFRMIVFYTLTFDPEQYKEVRLNAMKLFEYSGDHYLTTSPWNTSFQGDLFSDQLIEGNEVKGHQILYIMEEKPLPDQLQLASTLNALPMNSDRWGKLDGQWEADVTIDHDIFDAQVRVLPINQTIQVDGQKITFTKATVHPTVIHLEWKYAEENSKHIFAIEDMRLIDENGTEWMPLPADLMIKRSYKNKMETEMLFESNYFSSPKSLTLKGSTVRLLEKDKLDVVLDTETGTLLRKPSEQLKLEGIAMRNDPYRGEYLHMEMTVPIVVTSENVRTNGIQLNMGDVSDANGHNMYGSGGQGSGTLRWSFAPGMEFVSPLTIPIHDYHFDKAVDPFELTIPGE